MIWAILSRSQRAVTREGRRSSSSVSWRATAGLNSCRIVRASADRSTGSGCSATEPASSRDRSSRSTASFCSRSTCSAIVSRNSRLVSSSSSSSRSSSTKPPSEKIGVRSSCDAVATNSLRATSTWRS